MARVGLERWGENLIKTVGTGGIYCCTPERTVVFRRAGGERCNFEKEKGVWLCVVYLIKPSTFLSNGDQIL